jgi:hypothetical protein
VTAAATPVVPEAPLPEALPAALPEKREPFRASPAPLPKPPAPAPPPRQEAATIQGDADVPGIPAQQHLLGPSNSSQGSKLLVIAATCIFWAVALVLSGLSEREEPREATPGNAKEPGPVSLLAGLFGLAAIVSTVVLVRGAVYGCPRCKWWWALQFVQKRLVDQKHAYKTVSRTDRHSGTGVFGGTGGVSAGMVSGSTTRKEQVLVLRKFFESDYRCRFCSHIWIKASQADTEDFELPGEPPRR